MPKDIKELEKKKKIRYGWFAFLFVILHFSFIIFSVFPKNYTSKSIHKLSSFYVHPFFNQTWSMFAPCPVFENRFKLRYYFKNDTTNWIDPSIKILNAHKKYRLTYHGNIAVGQYNMLYWLKADLDTLPISTNQIVDFQDYPVLKTKRGMLLLKNYIKGFSIKNYGVYPIKTDIKINYKNVKDSSLTKFYYFENFK